MKIKIIFLVLFFGALLFSCGRDRKSEVASVNTTTELGSKEQSQPNSQSTSVTDPTPEPTEQRLIKNGKISFMVKSLTESKQYIKNLLKSYNGYIAKEINYGDQDNPSEELLIRIPNKNFDQFLDQSLKGAEEIVSRNIEIEDVTTQFVDIEARLKNKKQLENKYHELLLKATNIEDILKIEKEISYIREDIEASEGKLKYLGNQVEYSTISLVYYEKRSSSFDFGGNIGSALISGGLGLLKFIVIMVNLWPLWLIGGLIWYTISRIIKKNRKNKIKNAV